MLWREGERGSEWGLWDPRGRGLQRRQAGLWQGAGSRAGAAQLAGCRCQVSHLSLQGAKCWESRCRGAAVRTHFAKVLRAAGGARQWGGGVWGVGWGDHGRVAQLLSPPATQMCLVVTPRMLAQGGGGAWEANLGFQGWGGGGPSPL